MNVTNNTVEPKPYVNTAKCVIYGVEKFKDRYCKQRDDEFTAAKGLQETVRLNDMIENSTCQKIEYSPGVSQLPGAAAKVDEDFLKEQKVYLS